MKRVWAFPVVALASMAGVLGFAAHGDETIAHRPPTTAEVKVFVDRGQFTEAERALRRMKGPEARLHLGRFLAERGRWAEARPVLEEATLDGAHRVEAFQVLARESMSRSEWADALKYLRRLEEGDPKDPRILKFIAICLDQLGESIHALVAAQKALALAPGDRDLIDVMSRSAECAAVGPRAHRGDPRPLTTRRRMR